MPIVVALEKGEGSRSSGSKSHPMTEESLGSSLSCHLFRVPKEGYSFLRTVGQRLSTSPEVHRLPSHEDQKDLKYCCYHRKKRHTLEECVTFRKIFDEKHKGKILFQMNRRLSIIELPFPKNWDRIGRGSSSFSLRNSPSPQGAVSLFEVPVARGADSLLEALSSVRSFTNYFRSYQRVLSSKLWWSSDSSLWPKSEKACWGHYILSFNSGIFLSLGLVLRNFYAYQMPSGWAVLFLILLQRKFCVEFYALFHFILYYFKACSASSRSIKS